MISQTLWPAIAIVALVRTITFIFQVLGKEPSKEFRFLLALLGSLLSVLGAGHTDSLREFTEALLAVFAASQGLYNTAKRFIAVIRKLGGK